MLCNTSHLIVFHLIINETTFSTKPVHIWGSMAFKSPLMTPTVALITEYKELLYIILFFKANVRSPKNNQRQSKCVICLQLFTPKADGNQLQY